MRNFNFPIAPNSYAKNEEQIFRDHVRRSVNDAYNLASLITEALRYGSLPEYNNDADAGAGGLVQGQFYRTATGAVMVKM